MEFVFVLVAFRLSDADATDVIVDEPVVEAPGETVSEYVFICVYDKDLVRERVEDCSAVTDTLLVGLSDNVGDTDPNSVRVSVVVPVLGNVLVPVAFLFSDTDASGDSVDELVKKAVFVEVCEGDFDDDLTELRDRVVVAVMVIV